MGLVGDVATFGYDHPRRTRMATIISKEEADAHPNEVLDRAWAGEEIVIEQRGAPKLRLVPVEATPQARGQRRPGTIPGLKVPDSFWEPLSDEDMGWPADDRA
jgi:prevent-host-death family protein